MTANRRQFLASAAVAVAAAATPALAAPRVAKKPKGKPVTDAEIDRLLKSRPSGCMVKFLLIYNAPWPRVEDVERRLEDRRRWLAHTGDPERSRSLIAALEEELQEAVRLRNEEPARYAEGLAKRIDVDVRRPHGANDSAEWRMLEWLFSVWSAEIIEYVGDNGNAYLFDDWATWVHNVLRCSQGEIASHADLPEVTAGLVGIRRNLRDEKRTVPEIPKQASQAIDRLGYAAVFEAVYDSADVLDNGTEAVLDLLWDIVAECVAVSGVDDFEPLQAPFRASLIAMLEELNAEEPDEDEEPALAA